MNFNYNSEFPSGQDDTENCTRKVQGLNGELFYEKNDFVDIFVPEFCSSLRFDKIGKKVVDEIAGISYACEGFENSECKEIERKFKDFLDISTCR